MNSKKRYENERKFSNWIEEKNGIRIYYFDTYGKNGWKARYVKEVDEDENTLKFYQEIYNERSILIEKHEKYPVDKGHRRIK